MSPSPQRSASHAPQDMRTLLCLPPGYASHSTASTACACAQGVASLRRIEKLDQEARATVEKAASDVQAAQDRLRVAASLSNGGRRLAAEHAMHLAPVSTAACNGAGGSGAADGVEGGTDGEAGSEEVGPP